MKLAQHKAALADEKSNFLEQYSRNYNLRIYHVHEPSDETPADCERTVLKLFQEKMGLRHISKELIDVTHRLGKKKGVGARAIIVRFVSRRTRDEVFYSRKILKEKNGRSPVIAEDLTARNYQLYCYARQADVTKSCWTRKGKIFIQTHSGKTAQIKCKGDLSDPTLQATSSTENGGSAADATGAAATSQAANSQRGRGLLRSSAVPPAAQQMDARPRRSQRSQSRAAQPQPHQNRPQDCGPSQCDDLSTPAVNQVMIDKGHSESEDSNREDDDEVSGDQQSRPSDNW